MMINNLLILYPQVLWKFVVFRQGSQITVFVGGKYPFQNRMEVPHLLDDFLDKLLMLNQILAPQMENTCFIPVDEVVDLLGQPVVVGYVYDEVGEYFDGLIGFQMHFDFLYPGRGISKDHGHPQDSSLFLG